MNPILENPTVSILPYERFESYVKTLARRGILERQQTFGYRRGFADCLSNAGVLVSRGKAVYVRSVLDGNEYCYSNGRFKRHLQGNGMTEQQYAVKIGVRLPVSYVLRRGWPAARAKDYVTALEGGDELWFMYRSALASVRSDYRKLMLWYGIEESEARKIASASHEKRSRRIRGKLNPSFGKKGLRALCFRPFLQDADPAGTFGAMLRERDKVMILRWAADNDIDETVYERVRFLYYSMMFKAIHRAKGEEWQERFGCESVEQGIMLWNREKSLQCYDPRNFVEYNRHLVEANGGEADKATFKRLLREEKYDAIMSLGASLRENDGPGWAGRCCHSSEKYGEFVLRSKLEKGFIYIVDRLPCVRSVAYESVRISYMDGDRERTYVVDFEVVMAGGTKLLVEVKPFAQCVLPEGEVLAKKLAAESYGEQFGYRYLFVTERDMKYDLLRKKLQSVQGF